MIFDSGIIEKRCPSCNSLNVTIKKKIINQYLSLEKNCNNCNNSFAKILPIDNHAAINYPFEINMDTFEYKGELNNYTKTFLEIYKQKKDKNCIEYNFNYKFKNKKRHNKCLIVNTLDNAYGHSLMKVYGLKKIYENYGNEFDILVITFPQFEFLIPDFFNKFIVYKKFSDMKYYNNISLGLAQKMNIYKDYKFVINSTYPYNRNNIKKFFLEEYLSGTSQKKIIYIYRKELGRSWGLGLEKYRISKLFKKIHKKYKDYTFYIIGDLDDYIFPEFINDLRVREYNEKSDIKWIKILEDAELVIGVHGSHMIMPSLLSNRVINLLPKFKYSHIGEDIFTEYMNANVFIKSIQFLRGDYFLFNLTANKVYEIFENMIFASRRQRYFCEFTKKTEGKNNSIYGILSSKNYIKNLSSPPKDKIFDYILRIYKKFNKYFK